MANWPTPTFVALVRYGELLSRYGAMRPDPPGCEAQGGPGLIICPVRQQAQMTN